MLSADEVDAAVAAARAAFPAWRATSLSKRTEIMFKIRNLVEAAAEGDRRVPDRRARQGHLGRAGRDRPRHREPRVRDRDPEPAQGRVLRAGLERRRRLPDPPAARRRRRHHAVQLPGDGPDVDVRDRHRLRQHVHPQAVGEGPVGVELHRRVAPRPASPTASSTSSTATRWRSTPSSSIPTSRRSPSSGRRRSRATSTRPGRQRQARPGPGRCQEPHDRPARRRHRHGRRRRGLGAATARRASAAWPSRRSSRSATSAIRWSRRSRSACPRSRSGPGSDPASEMGPLVTREHRDKVASIRQGLRPRAPRSWPTVASTRSSTTPTASSSGSR